MNDEKHYTQQELNALSDEQLRLDPASLSPAKPKLTGLSLILWTILFTVVIVIACVFTWLFIVAGLMLTIASARYLFKS